MAVESAGEPIFGYCTNVHPGTTLDEVKRQLATHAVRVRKLRGKDAPLPVGLWFSADVASELAQPGQVEAFKNWLKEHHLQPYTLNGFPYSNFHQPVVKHAVYEPDWTTPQRQSHTEQLATLLAELLDAGDEGSISTLPIGWPASPDRRNDPIRMQEAGRRLVLLASHLAALEQRTGRRITVNLEPEPGCVLDTAYDIVDFFHVHVLPQAICEEQVLRHLGVCHDICHSAVMFEPQVQAIERYTAAGLNIGKVQISAAVRADFDRMTPDQARQALEQLRTFSEPKYLHQTTVQNQSGQVQMFEDLSDALEHANNNPLRDPWRVHFHVPINVVRFGQLESTQNDIAPCLEALLSKNLTGHFEVETYAWSVLPESMREAELATGIARELHWVDRWLQEREAAR